MRISSSAGISEIARMIVTALRRVADARRASALGRELEVHVLACSRSVRRLLSTYGMKTKLIVAFLVSSATALANPHDELAAAQQRVHDASTRISYYEAQSVIAERDIATARIHLDTASKQRNNARSAQAVNEQREAQARATQAREQSDQARSDLQASNDEIRRLERTARASR